MKSRRLGSGDKRQKKEQAIIEVALKLFKKYGFFKTTLNDIARESGMGKATLYYYFTGKEDIFSRIVRRERNDFIKSLKKRINAVQGVEDKLKLLATTRIKIFRNYPNISMIISNEYFSSFDFVEREKENIFKEEVQIIEDILKKGIQEGIFAIEDVHTLSLGIYTAIKGLESTLLETDSPADINRKVNSLAAVLFYGIKNKR